MPYISLSSDTLVRINNTAQTPVESEQQHLHSLYSQRLKFPFEDPYDISWQNWHFNQYADDFKQQTSEGRPKFKIDPNTIYDRDYFPFGVNEIFKKIFGRNAIFDYKRKFTNYTTTGYHINIGMLSEASEFLRYVRHAYFRQSYYRYSAYEIFKPTTELSEKDGLFLRVGCWGYFTKNAISATFNNVDGDGLTLKNIAGSSAVTWEDDNDYEAWISNNVSCFYSHPQWVGLNDYADYHGWLKYACDCYTRGEKPSKSIIEYYRDAIVEKISRDNLEIAEPVNEMYENFTQINKCISRELSLYFSHIDDEVQIPHELEEKGYITIKFSCVNALSGSYPLDSKLGTCGYYPILNDTSDRDREFILTCDYGSAYDIIDYERLLSCGREANESMPIITEYNSDGTSPIFVLATNPYDVYQQDPTTSSMYDFDPRTESKNNGRGRTDDAGNNDFEGQGMWINALIMRTQNGGDPPISAYACSTVANGHRSGANCLATPFAYWCEKEYYDTGNKNSNFTVHTVSNIRYEPHSSIECFQDARNIGFNCLSGAWESRYGSIYPRTMCKDHFPQYMKTRIRAVADKTYYPVYDKNVSEQIDNFTNKTLSFNFSSASIKLLRTGVDSETGVIDKNKYVSNEDPYYMRYRSYYKNDTEKQAADQYGTGTPPGKSYTGSSRPISAKDYQWDMVRTELLKPEAGWKGDSFSISLSANYLNPKGQWFDNVKAVGIVTDIGFAVKSDINIKHSPGFKFNSTMGYLFGGRDLRSDTYKYTTYRIVDLNTNNWAVFNKSGNTLREQNLYKMPIIVNTSLISFPNSVPISSDTVGFEQNFRTANPALSVEWQPEHASNAWNKLVNYLNTDVFPGCTDTKDYGRRGEPANVSYVIWTGQRCTDVSQTRNLYEHGEKFYITLTGFIFGVKYLDE